MDSDQAVTWGTRVFKKDQDVYQDTYRLALQQVDYAVYRGRKKAALTEDEQYFWKNLIFEKYFKLRVERLMEEAYSKGVAPYKDAGSNYGYLRKGNEKTPYWVELPRGIDVVTCNHAPIRSPPRKLQSCLRQNRPSSGDACEACHTARSTASESSESTVASNSDKRRVRFCDGQMPGDEAPAHVRAADGNYHYMPMHDDWVYIDRDICGLSVFETPDPDMLDFTSSPFGRDFEEELLRVQSANTHRLDRLWANDVEWRAHQREEQRLDAELRLAERRANRKSSWRGSSKASSRSRGPAVEILRDRRARHHHDL